MKLQIALGCLLAAAVFAAPIPSEEEEEPFDPNCIEEDQGSFDTEQVGALDLEAGGLQLDVLMGKQVEAAIADPALVMRSDDGEEESEGVDDSTCEMPLNGATDKAKTTTEMDLCVGAPCQPGCEEFAFANQIECGPVVDCDANQCQEGCLDEEDWNCAMCPEMEECNMPATTEPETQPEPKTIEVEHSTTTVSADECAATAKAGGDAAADAILDNSVEGDNYNTMDSSEGGSYEAGDANNDSGYADFDAIKRDNDDFQLDRITINPPEANKDNNEGIVEAVESIDDLPASDPVSEDEECEDEEPADDGDSDRYEATTEEREVYDPTTAQPETDEVTDEAQTDAPPLEATEEPEEFDNEYDDTDDQQDADVEVESGYVDDSEVAPVIDDECEEIEGEDIAPAMVDEESDLGRGDQAVQEPVVEAVPNIDFEAGFQSIDSDVMQGLGGEGEPADIEECDEY